MNAEKLAIVSDFDGTITLSDAGDEILRRFGAASISEIDLSYSPSTIIEEWMKEKFARLKKTPEEIGEFVKKEIRMREGAAQFAEFCEKNGIPFEIVSGGLDVYARPLLSEWGISVKSYFGKALYSGSGYSLEYPYLSDGKTLAAFKRERVEHYRNLGMKTLFFGDGTSDIQAAEKADIAYAVKKLAEHMERENIPHRKLSDFISVREDILDGKI